MPFASRMQKQWASRLMTIEFSRFQSSSLPGAIYLQLAPYKTLNPAYSIQLGLNQTKAWFFAVFCKIPLAIALKMGYNERG